jgi:tetratricopeptide (TPR) repeat protein
MADERAFYYRKEPSHDRPKSMGRGPFQVWWAITTTWEKISTLFVVFGVLALLVFLGVVAWLQYREARAWRFRAFQRVEAERNAGIERTWPLELDSTGRLVLDELDDVQPSEVAPPSSPSDLQPDHVLRAAVWLRQAERAGADEDWAAACELYQNVAEIFSESLRVQELLGVAALRARRYELAEQVFDRLTQRALDRAAWWNNLGVAQAGQGKLAVAATAFERAVEVAPAYEAARRNLGWLYVRLGQLDRAVEVLEPLVPNADEDLLLLYAVALLRQSRWSEAEKILETLTLRAPSAPVWFYLAEARSHMGQIPAALEALNRAVQLVDASAAARMLQRPEMELLRREPGFEQLMPRVRTSSTP